MVSILTFSLSNLSIFWLIQAHMAAKSVSLLLSIHQLEEENPSRKMKLFVIQ